jgi:hypothetical protein
MVVLVVLMDAKGAEESAAPPQGEGFFWQRATDNAGGLPAA